jgi:hypothetical protein
MRNFWTVMHRESGQFLRMSRFLPGCETPVYGTLEQSWAADSREQAVSQATFLGEDSHVAVEVTPGADRCSV